MRGRLQGSAAARFVPSARSPVGSQVRPWVYGLGAFALVVALGLVSV